MQHRERERVVPIVWLFERDNRKADSTVGGSHVSLRKSSEHALGATHLRCVAGVESIHHRLSIVEAELQQVTSF